MPDDDLLTLLLGCGCRRRCFCGAPDPAPAQTATPLFGQAPRTVLPPRLPDETPFIPTPASFDSPQLPDRWGSSHWPEVLAGGVFGGSGGGQVENVLIRDDGTLRALSATRVDHQTREVVNVNPNAYQTDGSGAPDPGDYGVPSSYAVLGVNQDPRVQPYNQGTIQAGVIVRTWTRQTIPYPDEPVTEEPVPVPVPGNIATGMVSRTGPNGQEIGTVYWREVYWELRAGGVNDPDSIWLRDAYIMVNLEDELRSDWLRLQSSPTIATRAGFAASGEPVNPNDLDGDGNPIPRESHRAGRLTWSAPGGTTAPARYPDEPGEDRWISPDGRVRVAGPITADHADLEFATLTAYGATFSVGTWAALCGPPGADGNPEAWIVHEAGGTVTLITPDGQTQTAPRAEFEAQVLRVPVGSLTRWASVGHLGHSWPPHWAVAEVGDLGYRAVILHDPWRDSRAAPPPPASTDPTEWSWPARPRRRPTALPLTAPGALLGLTLADVFREPATGGPVDT
ncbi:hypothetical protein ACMT4L_16685 [Deinococcus sp. A31D244]|uniref:hypothetical protein n=1 Tax=Deinococcus sp. A31D244 TaxID=3397675 RepID=UPI0039E08148